mmetsp:Transcript_11017/g.25002  ORF Transcript_11017/g.25002 Transcript_11017/m.25002 type:complete len:248 (+) Transcript_11017:747-1490(+)
MRDHAVGAVDRFTQLLAEDLLHGAQLAERSLAGLQGVGHVRLALEDVVGLGVMDSMRSLPREVWNKKSGVKQVSNSVLQELIVRESSVTALVGNHPAAGGDGTSGVPVEGPEGQERHLERKKHPSKGSGSESQGQRDACIHERDLVVTLPAVGGHSIEHLLLVGKLLVFERNAIQSGDHNVGKISISIVRGRDGRRCGSAGQCSSAGPGRPKPAHGREAGSASSRKRSGKKAFDRAERRCCSSSNKS